MADTARRNRRLLIAITAALAIAAIVVPLLSALLAPRHREQAAPVAPTTSTTPVLTIKPLGVRPVRAAFVTKPEECPPVVPTPPNQPLRTCDITRTAVYELGPEEVRLQLTNADSFMNPLANGYTVQLSLTAESQSDFARFTAAHIGQQAAFMRGGLVVWAPNITQPIDGQTLQMSGEVAAEQAAEIARLLRDGT